MSLRGNRFEVDLSSDDEDPANASRSPENAGSIPVRDIRERLSSNIKPPTSPSATAHSSGFPAHQSRSRLSRFKKQHDADKTVADSPVQDGSAQESSSLSPNDQSLSKHFDINDSEKASIDQENRTYLSNMSSESIMKEREEMLESLDPGLIHKLMNHSRLHRDNTINDDLLPPRKASGKDVTDRLSKAVNSDALADFGTHEQERFGTEHKHVPSIHFPPAPASSTLDPSSQSFFQDLHAKYLPSLPSDPSKLAWMSDKTPVEAPYLSADGNVSVSALRFSFDGVVIPPQVANKTPVTEGLHHHGDDPQSAGYTIPELARLARSAFPTQRCIAYQTLGRILYRLGSGEFGPKEGDIAIGLQKCVADGMVIETLQQEANSQIRHLTAKSLANEALWLWQKGPQHQPIA